MLQKTVYKSKAIVAGICIVTALLAVSVFPLRLWRKTVTFEGSGKPLVMSETADTVKGVSQIFVAGYERIRSFDVYVAEITGGRYLDAKLLSADGVVLFRRVIDLAETQIPGYVHIPAGVDLKPGLQYRLYLNGRLSAFRLGLEPVKDNPAPNMGAFFYENNPHPSLRLQMAAHYDVPLDKGRSLLVIAVLGALCALLCRAVRAWFAKHAASDSLWLLSGVVEKILYVISAAFYLVLFIWNFPLKRFHDSPGEILFLAVGIAVAAGATFYAIRQFCTGPEHALKMPLKDKIAALFFALAIAYGCEYMNGEYNLMHYASERQMLVCLLVVILLSFRTDMLVNRLNPVWAAASGAGAVWYVWKNALHAQTEQEAFQNTVSRCNALCIILAGLIVISAARSIRARVWHRKRISRFGVLMFAAIAALVIFSGTRVTGIILMVLCVVLYVCVGCNIPDSRFLRILVWGVNINFLLTTGYCLLFRAYQAFIFTRYGMVFPTVAVTGEYLASVTTIAAAQFLLKLSGEEETLPWRVKVRHAWKETMLFAVSGVYAVLTISRTAYLTIFTGVLVLLVVHCAARCAHGGKDRAALFVKRFLAGGCTMVFSCVLLFPGVFSMQRILPAVVGRHQPITSLEETYMIHDLLGSAKWDCTYYISGFRFWSIFRARILRQPEYLYIRAEDRYNYDEYARPLFNNAGEPVNRDAAGDGEEETGQEQVPPSAFIESRQETAENTVDISNGRLDIFRTYLSRLTLKGHDVLYTENPDYIHAHNSYLQVMYTNGIPAGVLFTVWIAGAAVLPLLFYHGSVRKRETGSDAGNEYLITAAASVSFATAALTEMNFQLCNPMCFLLITGLLPLIFGKEQTA